MARHSFRPAGEGRDRVKAQGSCFRVGGEGFTYSLSFLLPSAMPGNILQLWRKYPISTIALSVVCRGGACASSSYSIPIFYAPYRVAHSSSLANDDKTFCNEIQKRMREKKSEITFRIRGEKWSHHSCRETKGVNICVSSEIFPFHKK